MFLFLKRADSSAATPAWYISEKTVPAPTSWAFLPVKRPATPFCAADADVLSDRLTGKMKLFSRKAMTSLSFHVLIPANANLPI